MVLYKALYGSLRFPALNHIIPCIEETHENHGCHGSIHGSACNCVDHMVPCMALHGNLMNSDRVMTIMKT